MILKPDRHPSSLLLVGGMLTLSVVGLIGALLARSHDRLAAADREIAATKAHHAAEAGLAVAVETLRIRGGDPADLDLARRPLGDTGYTVRVNGVRGDRFELVSRGESLGVTRTVTAAWEIDAESGTARRCVER